MSSPHGHIRWSSIALLHNVVRTLTYLNTNDGHPFPVVAYRAKIKLHGTNCGIQITPSGLIPQSRTRLLELNSDYKGFARWVDANRSLFEAMEPGITVFGEWCGRGIEKGTGIASIDRKVFAVFAVQQGRGEGACIEFEPEVLRALLPEHPDLFVLPWYGEPLTLDYGDPASMDACAERLNRLVAEVEREDPWVKATFGKEGVGEGLVFYPLDGPFSPEALAMLMFKAKGDKHRTAGSTKAVQVAPDVAESVEAFAALMVTEARLAQGVTETCFQVKPAASRSATDSF
ncbi:MAG: RNA ligase family protein, partial [Myxococcota bacterium]